MALQDFWFIALAVLFLGFFVLEGFDFGVGMLMAPAGLQRRTGIRMISRRAVLNTIGPVWDGNEVWLITAGGAMFAAFPDWYATLFSGAVPAAAGNPVRHDPADLSRSSGAARSTIRAGARWADIGIALGSWLPAILWGVAFAILLRGLPVDADEQIQPAISDVLNPYTLLGGLATAALFAFHGAVFIALKTAGAVRDDAFRFGRLLSLPVIVVVGGFGLWTELAYGKPWTWLVLGVAVVALLAAVAAGAGRRPVTAGPSRRPWSSSPRWSVLIFGSTVSRTCCRRRSNPDGA